MQRRQRAAAAREARVDHRPVAAAPRIDLGADVVKVELPSRARVEALVDALLDREDQFRHPVDGCALAGCEDDLLQRRVKRRIQHLDVKPDAPRHRGRGDDRSREAAAVRDASHDALRPQRRSTRPPFDCLTVATDCPECRMRTCAAGEELAPAQRTSFRDRLALSWVRGRQLVVDPDQSCRNTFREQPGKDPFPVSRSVHLFDPTRPR